MDESPSYSGTATPPPLPTVKLAGLGPRFIALAMDCILVGMLGTFILVKILLPQNHHEAAEAFTKEYIAYQEAFENALEHDTAMPAYPDFSKNEPIIEMMGYCIQVLLLMFFVYFAGCEIFMRGTTLGKRVFNLRTVLVGTIFPPTALQSILRAAIKSYALVGLGPFGWLLLLAAIFISGRRGVHDVLCRTVVVFQD